MNEISGSIKFEEQGLTRALPVKYFVRTFDTNKMIRLHYHNSFEINICRGVAGVIRFGGDEHNLSPDCMILLPPETPHSYLIKSCSGTIDVFHILLESLPGAVDVLEGVDEIMKIALSECSSTTNEHLNAIKDSDAENKLVIFGHLLLLIGELKQTKLKHNLTERSIKLSGGKFLRRIIDYTETNYSERISLDEISSLAGVSKYHFCRLFKKETGETWSDYLRAVRLVNSLYFLRDGMSVAETAEVCGFDSNSYFIKCFKNEYNLTPMQWVKAEKIKKV